MASSQEHTHNQLMLQQLSQYEGLSIRQTYEVLFPILSTKQLQEESNREQKFQLILQIEAVANLLLPIRKQQRE